MRPAGDDTGDLDGDLVHTSASGVQEVFHIFPSAPLVPEPVWKEENIIFCDGWVPPQQLIREKFLGAS